MILNIVHWAFQIYFYVLLVYVLMSWVPNLMESPIGQFLRKLAEPYLSIFRRLIPPLGFIDLSPMVALIALHFVEIGVMTILGWILVGI